MNAISRKARAAELRTEIWAAWEAYRALHTRKDPLGREAAWANLRVAMESSKELQELQEQAGAGQ